MAQNVCCHQHRPASRTWSTVQEHMDLTATHSDPIADFPNTSSPSWTLHWKGCSNRYGHPSSLTLLQASANSTTGSVTLGAEWIRWNLKWMNLSLHLMLSLIPTMAGRTMSPGWWTKWQTLKIGLATITYNLGAFLTRSLLNNCLHMSTIFCMFYFLPFHQLNW